MTNVFGFLASAAGDPNVLLTTVVLPFLLIFVILWGVLGMMKIFGAEPTGRKINLVLALVITIFTAFTDAWGVLATQLAAATGVMVYVMFFAVFIIGSILWAIGRTRNIYDTHVYRGTNMHNIKELDKQLAKIAKKIQEAHYRGETAKEEVLTKTYDELEKRKNLILQKAQIVGGY